jgi:hypothetical protein
MDAVSYWGAGLSTILAGIKVWETIWRDRLKLATSYSWTGELGTDDTITIVNLSSTPVHVAYWTLAWKPRFLSWKCQTDDVTPDELSEAYLAVPGSPRCGMRA